MNTTDTAALSGAAFSLPMLAARAVFLVYKSVRFV